MSKPTQYSIEKILSDVFLAGAELPPESDPSIDLDTFIEQQEYHIKTAKKELNQLIYSQVLELIDGLYEYDTVAVERATYQDENFVCISREQLIKAAKAKYIGGDSE